MDKRMKNVLVACCLVLMLGAMAGAGVMLATPASIVPCSPGYPGCDGFSAGGEASLCTPGYPGCHDNGGP